MGFNRQDIPPEPYDPWDGEVYGTGTDKLNVRDAPWGNIVGYLEDGNRVTVIDEDNGWYKIGDNRWVDGSYIMPV